MINLQNTQTACGNQYQKNKQLSQKMGTSHFSKEGMQMANRQGKDAQHH